jgi:hypothetical protein
MSPVNWTPGLTGRITAALVLCAASGSAISWGEEGHRLIGHIADQHLTPQAARQVAYLLRRDRLASGEPSKRTTLAEIAYWADEIRDYGWGKARGRWHYDDIPVCGAPDPLRFCRKGNCASEQITRHLDMLKDPRVPLRQRNEALKWVAHLVGDIHQPLHAADHGDHGGNRIEASFFGKRDNSPYGTIRLHTIWDVHLLKRLLQQRGSEAAFLSVAVNTSDKAHWERGTLQQWMAESHRLGKEVVYGHLPGGFSCERQPQGIVAIDQRYYERAVPVLEAQIRKAGIRLARLINDALGR